MDYDAVMVVLPRTCPQCGEKLYHYGACTCAPRASSPVFKSLADFTDDEIAAEYYRRAELKLGDPRVIVSMPVKDDLS